MSWLPRSACLLLNVREAILTVMSADAASAANPEIFLEGLTDRVLRQFRVAAEDWFDVCRRLSEWEDKRLVDEPSVQALEQHAKVLRNLEWLGGLIVTVTESDEFTDRHFAELVTATLQDLKDRRALWHGTSTAAQREQLLHEIFPNKS